MVMGVPTLIFTCDGCGISGRGPRITTAARRIMCPDCHAYDGMDPLSRHWCPDWDHMPIDAASPEYECCTCAKAKTTTRT